MNNSAGIFIDAVNVTMNGGYGLRYDVLRRFACRSDIRPTRLNAYLAFDKRRAEEDESYRGKTERFSEVLRDFQFKVVAKPVQYYRDSETGETIIKSTVSMDMAVDMVSQARHLDQMTVLTNNGNYVSAIETVQQEGCRVELIGFDDVPPILKKAADTYISGYMIPGLLPIESPYPWGEIGSRVRGVCYDFSHDDGYGFIRYLAKINKHLWVTDSRMDNSPYETVFAHISEFENDFDPEHLPSRDLIFEMDLVENDKGLFAENIELVSAP